MLLRYGLQLTEFFVISDGFLPFNPAPLPPPSPNNLKNQHFKKMKKKPGDITILRMCTKNDNHMMYGSWHIERNGQNFLSFWTISFLFTPLTTWKIKIFKKFKKAPGDIIILHLCTISDNHIIYGSWDMERDGRNFLSFWTIFFLFTPLTTWEIKILKKSKKTPGDIIILHMCTINDNHIMYGSWDMERDGRNFLSFWTNFCTFNPLKTQKIQILKKWSNCLEILSFYTCAP